MVSKISRGYSGDSIGCTRWTVQERPPRQPIPFFSSDLHKRNLIRMNVQWTLRFIRPVYPPLTRSTRVLGMDLVVHSL